MNFSREQFFHLMKKGALWGILALVVVPLILLAPIEAQQVSLLKTALFSLLWAGVLVVSKFGRFLVLGLKIFALFCVIAFTHRLTFYEIPFVSLFTYSAGCLAVLSGGFLLSNMKRAPWRHFLKTAYSVILIFLFAVPFIYLGHYLLFDSPLNSDAYLALLDTNVNEAFEYITQFIGFGVLLSGFVVLLLIFVGCLYTLTDRRGHKWQLVLAALILLVGTIRVIDQPDTIDLYAGFWVYKQQYAEELEKFREMQKTSSENKGTYQADTAAEGETHILVIGESLNKYHMGLYGYPRNTTPQLDARMEGGNMIALDKAFSSHTHTVQTLTLALTTATQENEQKYYASPTIIDMAEAAGYDTAWLTNQVMMGSWDSPISIIALSADTVKKYNTNIGEHAKTNDFDDVIIDGIEEALANASTENNQFIVVHLMGNHGDYCLRYPTEYAKFQDDLTPEIFGKKLAGDNRQINCYDNSVTFNDYVVSSVIDKLAGAKRLATLTYLSDHADDVINAKGHNSSIFTYDMTSIPFLVWASDEYKDSHKERLDTLREHVDTPYANEQLFHYVLGNLGIRSDVYDPKQDIASTLYEGDKNNLDIVHRKFKWNSAENPVYEYARLNDKWNADEYGRVLPHRINSLGKLMDVRKYGLDGYETDLIFQDGVFKVSHDREDVHNLTLKDLLEYELPGKSMKIWLDVKNLGDQTFEGALSRLTELDVKYDLKDRVIVESSTRSEKFADLSNAGFHISYYLPTGHIDDLLEEKDENGLKAEAQRVSEQAKLQNLSAVSFDIKLYPFVTEYLEQLLPQDIVYHTWDLKKSYEDKDIEAKLGDTKYSSNKRIKTILLDLPSKFHL
ncbi:MAG: hypothetical protein CMH28_03950 [Micavibrio sp.]|nr:hypothetical protein [Micavibrio sp.]